MKIDETYRDLSIFSSATESNSIRRIDQQEAAAGSAEKGVEPGEDVKISNTSIEFSRASERMDQESPERAEKIKEIQAKIQDGTYRVDSAKVAEKILMDILNS